MTNLQLLVKKGRENGMRNRKYIRHQIGNGKRFMHSLFDTKRYATKMKRFGVGNVSFVQVFKNNFEKYRINLWFPFMCHNAFGAETEYCLRLSVVHSS